MLGNFISRGCFAACALIVIPVGVAQAKGLLTAVGKGVLVSVLKAEKTVIIRELIEQIAKKTLVDEGTSVTEGLNGYEVCTNNGMRTLLLSQINKKLGVSAETVSQIIKVSFDCQKYGAADKERFQRAESSPAGGISEKKRRLKASTARAAEIAVSASRRPTVAAQCELVKGFFLHENYLQPVAIHRGDKITNINSRDEGNLYTGLFKGKVVVVFKGQLTGTACPDRMSVKDDDGSQVYSKKGQESLERYRQIGRCRMIDFAWRAYEECHSPDLSEEQRIQCADSSPPGAPRCSQN